MLPLGKKDFKTSQKRMYMTGYKKEGRRIKYDKKKKEKKKKKKEKKKKKTGQETKKNEGAIQNYVLMFLWFLTSINSLKVKPA
jgi:hypothetical protein